MKKSYLISLVLFTLCSSFGFSTVFAQDSQIPTPVCAYGKWVVPEGWLVDAETSLPDCNKAPTNLTKIVGYSVGPVVVPSNDYYLSATFYSDQNETKPVVKIVTMHYAPSDIQKGMWKILSVTPLVQQCFSPNSKTSSPLPTNVDNCLIQAMGSVS